MTTMEKIIDKLASKELSFGCQVQDLKDGEIGKIIDQVNDERFYVKMDSGDDNYFDLFELKESNIKILGHPVHKMHIEALFKKEVTDSEGYVTPGTPNLKATLIDLFNFWEPCGLTKSLQEIAECGYEEVAKDFTCSGCDYIGDLESLRDHAIQDIVNHSVVPIKKLKNLNAQSLAEFINSII